MDSDVASDDSTLHSDGESAMAKGTATTETPQPQGSRNAITSASMRVFLQYTSKEYSLRRYLQQSVGPRQHIIEAMMQMTFRDFCKYTHTYPCDILYDLEKCHQYVTTKPGIWPPNLYISLKDLKKYLLAKGIVLHNLDLRCVPPVFLHWCDLVKVTNFDQCVQYDYYKETGKFRMSAECLRSRRKKFYQRCWKAGEWVWRPPVITDNNLLLRMQESIVSVTPRKPVNIVRQAKGHGESNAATMNSTELVQCHADGLQLQEDVIMDVPVESEVSPSVPSQSLMHSETVLEPTVASSSVDVAVVSQQQPLAGIPETDSPTVAIQQAQVANSQAKGYIIGAGAHLHPDIIMRSIKARVSDTSKHAEILARIQNVIRRHQEGKQKEHATAKETVESERHPVVAQQTSPNTQQETNMELRGEMLSPVTAKLPDLPRGTEQKSLHYPLRLAFGPKHHIIWAILQMTFVQFLQYTRIYPHETLLGDLQTAELWHRNAISVSGSWPENLYIRLVDLKEYLLCKDLRLHKMDLRCVTPTVLHWSDLMHSTNFDQLVQYDYFRETGRRRMSQAMLRKRRVTYYRRCCIAGDWLWHAPTVTDAAVLQQFSMLDDADIRDVSQKSTSTQQATDASPLKAGTTNNIAAANVNNCMPQSQISTLTNQDAIALGPNLASPQKADTSIDHSTSSMEIPVQNSENSNTAIPPLTNQESKAIGPNEASPQQADTSINHSTSSMEIPVQNSENSNTANEACDTSLTIPLPPEPPIVIINMSQDSLILTPTIRRQTNTTGPSSKRISPAEAEQTDATQSHEKAMNKSNTTQLESTNISGTTESRAEICTAITGPSCGALSTPINERVRTRLARRKRLQTDSLHYHVRLAVGPKQAIIWAMLQMSFEEFRRYTHSQPSREQCNEKVWQIIYKHVIDKPGIWPPGLFIRLGDLREYLQLKGVLLHEWDLRCVSPMFLHWSDLRATTNFDQCVQYYHYRTEGSTRLPAALLPKKRKKFYHHCWKAGEWLGRAPVVTDPQLRQQMLEANDVRTSSSDQHTSDCEEKQPDAADSPKGSAPLNVSPSRQSCDVATTHEPSTKESEQNPAPILSEKSPEGVKDPKDSSSETPPEGVKDPKDSSSETPPEGVKDSKAATKAVRKHRKLPEGFLTDGAPTKKKRKPVKKKVIETFVPQLTHQFKALPVNVVKKKDHPANNNVLTDISNNNAVEVTPSAETKEWTPSQEFAVDNTLFNATALVRVAEQAAVTETPSTSVPPRVGLQVIEALNSHSSRQQGYGILREETEIFFHDLQCFDYYHALTYDHIQRDLLYETEIGKRYAQAKINYGGRHTKVYGDFFATLFACSSRQLLADFQYVLASLGEYHYKVYKKRDHVEEDQRRRVLDGFLRTRPIVSRCKLRFDSATREYAKVHRVEGYASKGEAPAKERSVVGAMKPHILEEIKLLKAKLANE